MFLPNDIVSFPDTFFMAAAFAQAGSYILLQDLAQGSTGPVLVMVSRKWDVNNTNGRYISSDFLLSDNKVKSIHYLSMTSYLRRLQPNANM